MGVQSLWNIVGSSARPVKLEALSRKKLAVDASIWIYQFMKAVRDKEGNALSQSHIVGFFRRICKMLYFGILPIFVFDGDAPPLKRQVMQNRRARRQGKQDSAKATAQKLLAMQIHKDGIISTSKEGNKTKASSKQTMDANHAGTYYDDLPHYREKENPSLTANSETDRQRSFRKKDEFHLPELKEFSVKSGDQRVIVDGELEKYMDESFDFVDGISIDSVDPSSKEFSELPLATQYMILSHLRLRSRLRLGYSKAQLEHLFPNSHDFSKFQIQQVQKRNYYTQKLMNVSGMSEESGNVSKRIAGEKDRQYMLVKNEGGWTLSLGGEGGESQPIELDPSDKVIFPHKKPAPTESINSDDSDDDELEDIPLETSNISHLLDSEGHIKEDFENEQASKAVIESIYNQHEGDFGQSTHENVAKDEELQDRIETYLETDIRKAIEVSKLDYFHQKSIEADKYNESSMGSEFDARCSSLLGYKEISTGETPLKTVNIEISDDKDNAEKINVTNKSKNHSTQSVPIWFSDKSHISSPHNFEGVLLGKHEQHKLDENEEAGIISWSEAKEYMKQVEMTNDDASIVTGAISDSDSHNENEVMIVEDHDISRNHENYKKFLSNVKEDDEMSTHEYISRDKHDGVLTHSKLKSDVTSSEVDFEKNEASDKTGEVTEKIPREEDASNNKEKPSKNLFLSYVFNDDDEELISRQLDEEEEEHARFTEVIQKDIIPVHTKVNTEQLLQEKLQKAKRDADEVTQTMINDVQELLKRFGIPYLTAPMEAEAQCAELLQLGLVDGIVTDDSDCFLFGGSRVYKNMFNQKQYVECYILEELEHKMGLNRDKLIDLALLLGSDYTQGIKGIGPVLAMEILAEFGDLHNLKNWYDRVIISKNSDTESVTKLQKTLISRIRNGKLYLPDSFPDQIVKDAYKHPEVDNDDSEIRWGVPQLDQIRSFLMYNVGWSQERVDEVMVPLIRNINNMRAEGKQSTISEFFPQEYISHQKTTGMGKRMKLAANRIRGDY